MTFLCRERQTLEVFLPGLDAQLAAAPLMHWERPGSEALRLFKAAGGPSLLIPPEFSGKGASAVEAIRVQRALGSRSPSLAVATTMHHFSVATMLELGEAGTGAEGLLLAAIAQQQLLVASGFAEGRAGQGILTPTMRARRTPEGVVVSGTKKPCSLTWSMDLLTASVAAVSEEEGGEEELLVVLVPADAPGLERERFWESGVLGGAESDAVTLRDVFVPERLLLRLGTATDLDPVQMSGFLWFEVLVAAGYLGVASALIERVLHSGRGTPEARAELGMEVEGAMAAVEGVAWAMEQGERGADALARALRVRYACERAVERASALAAELLGGMAFIRSPDVSYLYGAARVLAFHPPSRVSAAPTLADHLVGQPLRLP